MAKPILTLEEKFWQRVDKGDGSGCWLWTGGINPVHGYGNLHIGGGRYVRAHRWSFARLVGRIRRGACVLHRCDVRSCVRPDHLFLGDRQINGSDMAIKGRGWKSKRGLPYGVNLLNHPGDKPFVARVRVKRALHYLGTFRTADEASAAAVAFRDKQHSEVLS